MEINLDGYVSVLLLWFLVASPIFFCQAGFRNGFLGFAGFVCTFSLAMWLSFAGSGYRITENMSSSLDGHFFLHKQGESVTEPLQKGDLVAYRWNGGPIYPAGSTFIKRVVGVPGDVVRRVGREFWVGEQRVGLAKTRSRTGLPLQPAAAGVIAPGEYFVATPNPDSLDSRYASKGNVRGTIKQREIFGKAYEIF